MRHLLLLSLAALLGCRAPQQGWRPEFGLAPSFLPNLGIAASASVQLRQAQGWEWRAETRFTDQFLDDKDVSDNGMPEAGNWTQLELGLRVDERTEERTRWSWRFGVLGFEARGEPNIVDESGEYFGVYGGVGRYTDFGHGLSFGPELTLIAAHGEDPSVLIPQITWGLRWTP